MTEQELIELVRGGERPGVEFKDARLRHDGSFVEVAKAALGLVNRQDRGFIIIGVRDDRTVTGLTAEQEGSWSHTDTVRQELVPYADPHIYVDVEIVRGTVPDLADKTLAVVIVHPFEQIPVLCKKDALNKQGKLILKAGSCYIRSRHMPATTEIARGDDLRELMRIAIDRGVREFVRTATSAGLTLSAAETDRDRFAAQERALDE